MGLATRAAERLPAELTCSRARTFTLILCIQPIMAQQCGFSAVGRWHFLHRDTGWTPAAISPSLDLRRRLRQAVHLSHVSICLTPATTGHPRPNDYTSAAPTTGALRSLHAAPIAPASLFQRALRGRRVQLSGIISHQPAGGRQPVAHAASTACPAACHPRRLHLDVDSVLPAWLLRTHSSPCYVILSTLRGMP